MFTCDRCAEELKLSDLGRKVHALDRSFGPCESCDEYGSCGEVSCQIDAYWKDDVEAQLKKWGYH